MSPESRSAQWILRGARGLGTLAGVVLCSFAYLTAGHNKGFAVLASGAPFLLSSVLILASRHRSRG
jgi:hypothetical protein